MPVVDLSFKDLEEVLDALDALDASESTELRARLRLAHITDDDDVSASSFVGCILTLVASCCVTALIIAVTFAAIRAIV